MFQTKWELFPNHECESKQQIVSNVNIELQKLLRYKSIDYNQLNTKKVSYIILILRDIFSRSSFLSASTLVTKPASNKKDEQLIYLSIVLDLTDFNLP